jgi:hypothetical protein
MFNLTPDLKTPQVTINGVVTQLNAYSGAAAVSLSGCDGGAYVGPVVATEDSFGEIRVFYPSGFNTYGISFWPGHSPRVFNLELVGGSGVICYFLSPDRTKLMARLAADTWFVDYILIDSLPVPLARLTKVDANGSNTAIRGTISFTGSSRALSESSPIRASLTHSWGGSTSARAYTSATTTTTALPM